jgi:hypothetical protein
MLGLTIETLKQALNTNGPCIISFAVYNRVMYITHPKRRKNLKVIIVWR